MIIPPKLVTEDEPVETIEEDNIEFFEYARSRSVSRASHIGTMNLKIPNRSVKNESTTRTKIKFVDVLYCVQTRSTCEQMDVVHARHQYSCQLCHKLRRDVQAICNVCVAIVWSLVVPCLPALLSCLSFALFRHTRHHNGYTTIAHQPQLRHSHFSRVLWSRVINKIIRAFSITHRHHRHYSTGHLYPTRCSRLGCSTR